MEFLKTISRSLGLSRKKTLQRNSKTKKIRSPPKSKSPSPKSKSPSPKKSKIFQYVRGSATHRGEHQKPNEEKALTLIKENDFDINKKAENGETLLGAAFRAKNKKIFKAMLDHPSTNMNDEEIKPIIIEITQLVNAKSDSFTNDFLIILKNKGVFKRGYLPSELRKLVKDKV